MDKSVGPLIRVNSYMRIFSEVFSFIVEKIVFKMGVIFYTLLGKIRKCTLFNSKNYQDLRRFKFLNYWIMNVLNFLPDSDLRLFVEINIH